MAESLFPADDESAIYLSRSDETEDLGCVSQHPFFLDEKEWPTAEHYYQAMKFSQTDYQEKIRSSATVKQAKKLGGTRFKRRRSDWKKVKTTVMTRAIYTKCRTYSHIQQKLLDTGEEKLVENSQYDYYWGCGRDRRGENHYGKVLMNVRKKLQQEQELEQTDSEK